MNQLLKGGTLFILFTLMSCIPQKRTHQIQEKPLALIPKPNSIQLLDESFDLMGLRGIATLHGSDIEKNIGKLFINLLKTNKTVRK